MKIFNGITYAGVLDKADFPTTKDACIFKQKMVDDCFHIPDSKPDVESIIAIIVEACITKTKIIPTLHGRKIIVHGIVNIKIEYVAKNPEQSVHSAHFTQNFYTFINCNSDDFECSEIQNCIKLTSYIEDVEVSDVNERCFNLTTLILITVKICCTKHTCKK